MVNPPRRGLRRAREALRTLRTQLTRQFITRNRRLAFALSAAAIAIAIAAVHVSVWWFSPGVMILPILAGGLLLWPRALRIFFVFVAVAVAYDVVKGKAGAGIVATIVLTAVFADILARTREQLGVKGMRGDRMLLELRDRIRAQARLPPLGEGWGSSVVLKPAWRLLLRRRFRGVGLRRQDAGGGAGRRVRKGIDAGTRALLLSGAFGGLLGSVPRDEFLPACNAYLRRGPATEGFVTAIHLALELASGEYVIASAGHPPAVHYDGASGRWRLTRARGIVLGVVPDLRGVPTETERGVLQRGDALRSIPTGWWRRPARTSTRAPTACSARPKACWLAASEPAPPAMVDQLARASGGSDDCALVLIWRT